MPQKELMNWEGDRWSVTFSGKRFYVGPRSLKKAFPHLFKSNTREGSREAANAWWESQRGVKAPPAEPIAWTTEWHEKREAQFLADYREVVGDPGNVKTLSQEQKTELHVVQKHQAKKKAPALSKKDRSLESQIKSFLARKQIQAEAGEISFDRYDNLRVHLQVFKLCYGDTGSVEDINGQTLLDFHTFLIKGIKEEKYSRSYAASCMRDTKQFIRHLWALELCELPRNMASSELEIFVPVKKVKTFTVEEIKNLLAEAGDRTKLYFLLAVNCGYTQEDISNLRPDEVDWKQGRIIRKRSKTEDSEDVPEVNYKLWPETFRLLKKEGNRAGDWVLLNEDGKPLKQKKIAADGVVKKIDNIRCAYQRVAKKLHIDKHFRLMRKTASSMLDHHNEYSRFEQLFLGHSPRTIADRHYVDPSSEQFDAAVAWLGKQFGF